MTSAILIPCAQTDWQAAGRFVSSTPVDVNEEGELQVEKWASMIIDHAPVAIYCSERSPSDQTARLLAERLNKKFKRLADLEEIGMGLWEGLTPQQLKKRFGKAHKQWKDDPSSVHPPEGEDLADGAERLLTVFNQLARKHSNECFGVVLGPLALPAMRCNLEEAGFEMFWKMASDQPVRYLISADEGKAVLTT
jgi:broad specificity phosphatase PhoE